MVRSRSQAGVALVLALVALSVVVASVLLVASMIDDRRIPTSYEYRSVVLRALSDAALAESLALLSTDPSFVGIAERPFGGGGITSSVATTPVGTRMVVSVSSFDGWRSVLTAEVALEESGPRVLRVSRHQTAR
jgi:hypothetical protein